MDIWEANSMANAYTPHPCNLDTPGQYACDGIECGDNDKGERFDGVCDKNGCDFQTYRLGNTAFYGRGAQFQIDTTKKMTVVTQFITDDGTDGGRLSEIRRFYQQDGRTIGTPTVTVPGAAAGFDSITEGFCAATEAYFNDNTTFLRDGGFNSMDDAHGDGMVLVMSIWDDYAVNMKWLDSTWPEGSNAPGAERGPCPSTGSEPETLEANFPGSK